MKRMFAATLCTLVLAGCGDSDPLGPVISPTITLTVNSMNSSDIESGMLDKDENISTETGNPWGEFIRMAEDECKADPVGFEVTHVALSLDTEGSNGVAGLDDVFSGAVSVIFRSTQGSDEDAAQVAVGSGPVSGAGNSTLVASGTRSALAPLYERLLGGDFHVAVRGGTDRQHGDDFSMDVRVTFATTAFCG